MNEQELKEQIAEIKTDIREIRALVTNLRVDQEGLKVKASMFGLMGGALSAIPVIIAILLKN